MGHGCARLNIPSCGCVCNNAPGSSNFDDEKTSKVVPFDQLAEIAECDNVREALLASMEASANGQLSQAHALLADAERKIELLSPQAKRLALQALETEPELQRTRSCADTKDKGLIMTKDGLAEAEEAEAKQQPQTSSTANALPGGKVIATGSNDCDSKPLLEEVAATGNDKENLQPEADNAEADGAHKEDGLTAKLSERLVSVKKLALQSRIVEAHEDLAKLRRDIQAALQNAKGSATEAEIRKLAADADNDTMLMNLEEIHGRHVDTCRLLSYMSELDNTSAALIHTIVPCESYHPDCTVECLLRYLKPHERDERKGKSTDQFVCIIKTVCSPTDLPDSVSLEAEFPEDNPSLPSYVKSLTAHEGTEEQLYGTFVVMQGNCIIPLPLFPKEEHFVCFDFPICTTPPHPKVGPGVMKLEHRPEPGSTYRGWTIPEPTPGYKHQSGQEMLTYFYPNAKNPSLTDQVIIVCDVAPVPQWVFPARVVKSLCPGIVRGLLDDLQKKVYARWDELEFKSRIAADVHSFYRQLASLGATPGLTDELPKKLETNSSI